EFLGNAAVDFRIVELTNITANERMLFSLVADYCQSELVIYGLQTLSWMLFAKLYRALRRPPNPWPPSNVISRLQLTAVHGYPRVLTRFKANDRFEIIDLWYAPRGVAKSLLNIRTSRIARECEAREDTPCFDDCQLQTIVSEQLSDESIELEK